MCRILGSVFMKRIGHRTYTQDISESPLDSKTDFKFMGDTLCISLTKLYTAANTYFLNLFFWNKIWKELEMQ